MNTPQGVTWNEDHVSRPWGEIIRKWRSTEYITNGVTWIHLVAESGPNFFQQNPPHNGNGVVITEFSLSITVSN